MTQSLAAACHPHISIEASRYDWIEAREEVSRQKEEKLGETVGAETVEDGGSCACQPWFNDLTAARCSSLV